MALDEASASFLAQLEAAEGKPLQQMTPDEAREFGVFLAQLVGSGPELASVRDEALPTGDGGHFRVRVLTPAGAVGGVVVYYHGGGWVLGDIDEYDTLARTLATRLGVAVVNVDYRLAPEHRYPAAVNDAWTALEWASERVTEIAGHPAPLIVTGDSAGGNLAAVVAQRASKAGQPRVDAQVLVYPVTDADVDDETYRDPQNQLLLTREGMIWFWDHYAPDPASRKNPDASPLQANDLSGLPPAIVVTAEYDPLREEGEAYADRMRAAGVPVEQQRFSGQMHHFFAMLNVLPGSAEAISYIADKLCPRLAAD